MKQFIALTLWFAVPSALLADDSGGGFSGPGGPTPVTAIEVRELPDDTDVIIEGYITRAIGRETYEFRDETGTLIVEIDDDEWNGIQVTPDLRVRISGETEDGHDDEQVDADSVRLAD